MSTEVIIKNIKNDQFSLFNVTEEELISFALDDSGLIIDTTLVNGKNARDLVKSFYNKRESFRLNSMLGHILVREYNLPKDSLIQSLTYHEENGVPLGEAFIKLGFCTSEQITTALETQSKMRSYMR